MHATPDRTKATVRVFGILRPCRHSLPGDLAVQWLSHLCGLCLALRDGHGQTARVATNYDGLVVSALVAAQTGPGGTRTAGACPLRGMRRAEVAHGTGAHLAASVSLLLAAAKVTDHVADGDGVYGHAPVRAVARTVSTRWARQARQAGQQLGFDAGALLAAAERQTEVEADLGPGDDLLAATAPTEEATAAAFAHTALLAGRPGNEAALREAGRLFGRVAHLLDAVEDQEADRAAGAWNPITATGTDPARVRQLCDDAVLGVRLALAEAEFVDGRLVHALLVHELDRAVRRSFAAAGHAAGPSHRPGTSRADTHPGEHGDDPARKTVRPRRPRVDQGQWCCTVPEAEHPPRRRGFWAGCAVALFMTCTGQVCCRDPYPGPWKGRPREACCASCGDCCDPGCCRPSGDCCGDCCSHCCCCPCD